MTKKFDLVRTESRLKRNLNVLKSVTIEPAALFLMTSVLMSYLISQDLILEKACRVNLRLPTLICDSIKNKPGNFVYTEEEAKIQTVAAEVRTYRSIIDHSFPILFVLFMGPWSDIYGRKIPMLMSIFGFLLQAGGLILCSYYEEWDAYTVGLVAAVSKSLFGSEVTFSMAAYSYLSDKTSTKSRTVRTGLFKACFSVGVPLGFAIGGALSRTSIGYIGSFAISGAFSLVSFMIVLFTVANTRPQRRKKNNNNDEEDYVEEDEREHDEDLEKSRRPQTCLSIMNPRRNVFEVILIPFKQRDNNGRIKIFLLLISFICVSAPIHGEFGVMYLFLRHQLNWDAGDYGIFSSYNFVIGIVGTVVSMGVLSYFFKLSDPLVGFISGISQFSSCFLYAFATTATAMYFAPAVDMMNGTMVVIAKAMLSKLVFPHEIGKLFSLIAVLESLTPLVMDPTYSTLYKNTFQVFAGSFFILSAALTIPPLLIYLWFLYDGVKECKKQRSKAKDIDTKDDKLAAALSTTTMDTVVY